MVLPIVSSFVGLIKTKFHTTIDSAVFRLHYRWATSFCFLACGLVSATEYIGNAIQCMGIGDNVIPKAVNTYCWIMSTHTLNNVNKNGSYYLSRGTNYMGIGSYNPGKDSVTYHSYYQWVPFFLFFQGCLFYLPHLLWKTIEGKTADNLLQGLHFYSIDGEREQKIKNIVKYLKDSRGHNRHYAITYLLCEALNLINVLAQMFLLDKFLGGVFFEYGLKVMSPELHAGPLASTFPRMTKCNFKYYGPGGEITKDEYLCVLPQNVLNEKVFIIMWFLLVALTTITAIELIWRIVVAVSPLVRVHLLEIHGKVTVDPKLEKIISCMHLGDFCLLYIIGNNLDARNFKELLLSYADCHDNYIHPNNVNTINHNGDTTYRPFSHLDEVDNDDALIVEARV